jgi:hypothetical protein
VKRRLKGDGRLAAWLPPERQAYVGLAASFDVAGKTSSRQRSVSALQGNVPFAQMSVELAQINAQPTKQASNWSQPTSVHASGTFNCAGPTSSRPGLTSKRRRPRGFSPNPRENATDRRRSVASGCGGVMPGRYFAGVGSVAGGFRDTGFLRLPTPPIFLIPNWSSDGDCAPSCPRMMLA